jgi:hypothetical protein
MKIERHKIIDIGFEGLKLRPIFNSGLDGCNRRLKVRLNLVSRSCKIPMEITCYHHKHGVHPATSRLGHDQVQEGPLPQMHMHVSGRWQLQTVQFFETHGSAVVSNL